MNVLSKEALLDKFRLFLETNNEERSANNSPDAHPVDLYTLLCELAALKNEVRLEARQFKTALESFGSSADTLRTDKETLLAELDRCRQAGERKSRDAVRGLLTQILDLRDRIEAGLSAAENYRPKRFRLCRRRKEHALIKALREGQSLTLGRLDQLLTSHNVLPIEVIGQILDPHTMRAAEIDQHPKIDAGVVTGELRKGFSWGDEILRPAEVRVNKPE